MFGLLISLFGAFSFLAPSGSLLVQSMGFSINNPSDMEENTVTIMGQLGTLDAKTTFLSAAFKNAYFKASYASLGEIEVRGDVPQDNSYLSSYPYVFEFEAGGNMQFTENARLGASFSIFEQRIMADGVKGYAVNLGGKYAMGRLVIGGYVRNIGPSVGYNQVEKYALFKTGELYSVYNGNKNTLSIALESPLATIEDFTLFLGYTREFSPFIRLGGEIALEKDMSVGYRNRYPVVFMLKVKRGKYSVGFDVHVPSGGLDIKNSVYLGVSI